MAKRLKPPWSSLPRVLADASRPAGKSLRRAKPRGGQFRCSCLTCPRRAAGLLPGETPCAALVSARRTAANARAELDEYLLGRKYAPR
jgi:hypothetical protein